MIRLHYNNFPESNFFNNKMKETTTKKQYDAW